MKPDFLLILLSLQAYLICCKLYLVLQLLLLILSPESWLEVSIFALFDISDRSIALLLVHNYVVMHEV